MEKLMIRHGDVFVAKIEAIPVDARSIKGRILAYGEATGHAHRLDVGELFETRDGKLYFILEKEGRLSHEEHKTIVLPAGNYEVVHQREYTPQAIVRVTD